jgi:RNA polymerase sigma-70 factor, ECF subfamily
MGAQSALDDLTQETFVRAWKNRDTIRSAEAEKAWVFKIALHAFYDFKKRKDSSWEELAENAVYLDEESESRVENRLDALKALSVLSLNQRLVCLLFYIEGFTVGEIAEMESIPEGTVKTRLMKARELMQAALEVKERSYAKSKA